ncbi:MAG: hypothetical protein J6D03_11415 [Clostridia bacterium]|nr:hypothetical protein [Clostridia bacterium]MBO5005793.1 hypothetical protein [Clostridia bacterium]
MTNEEVQEIFTVEVMHNVELLYRESRHLRISDWCREEVKKIYQTLNKIHLKVFFVEDANIFVHKQILDLMDYIKFELFENQFKKCSKYPDADYRVLNSIYDVIGTWYFED